MKKRLTLFMLAFVALSVFATHQSRRSAENSFEITFQITGTKSESGTTITTIGDIIASEADVCIDGGTDAPGYLTLEYGTSGGTFKVQDGDIYQYGEEVTCVEGIRMTFGQMLPEGQERTGQYADFAEARASSNVDDFVAYTGGNGANPKDKNGEMYTIKTGNVPINGTFYTFEPEYDGALTIGIVLNKGKAFYVLDDGEPVPEFRAVYISPEYGQKYYGIVALNVKGGHKYHVFATGSKLGYYGFSYQPGKTTDIVGPEGTRELLLSSIKYSLPEEDILYDGEAHGAIVEDVVGRGILHIIYKDGEGNESETTPVDTGTYTVSFDFEEGELFSAARFEDLGTFSIYALAEQDWTALVATYASMGQGQGWKHVWDFSGGIITAKNLYGVTFEKGRVTAINLCNNGLTGNFPLALLTMTNLRALDVSNNELSGDIGMLMAAFKQQNPTAAAAVRVLDISGNQLTGNIGLFANCFTNLQSLDASYNCLEEVYPMIPATVAELNISHQTISRVVDLHLSELSTEVIAAKTPSILLYDHANQTYTTNINLLCTTSDNSWGLTLSYQNGQLSIPYVSEQNTYYGKSGDILNVTVINNNGTREGSSFRIKLSYDEGDGNFDGQVNVLDLQTDINYIIEKYKNRPYNFTASNLWKDELINIQDIICLVNLMMEAEPAEEQTANARERASKWCDASVYVENGQLILNTTQPVAALDITLRGANAVSVAKNLERMGIIFNKRVSHDGIRIIAYSTNGICIPAGITTLGNLKATAASVRSAMLSNSDANGISVSVESNTTDINTIANGKRTTNDTVYDLQGRQVESSKQPHGLYIKNGKKIFK